MTLIRSWISAFRLRTLPLALSCVITGNALSLHHSAFSLEVFWLTVLTTILLQVLSNLANDYGDFQKGTDNDQRIGPKRAVQSGAISPIAMRNAVIVCALLSLLSGVLLLLSAFSLEQLPMIALFLTFGLLAIAAAIKYTVGKAAYGYYGMGDLFVLVFFGWLGVGGSMFLQTKSIDSMAFLPATAIGILSMAVLNLNNMRDRENDMANQKNTLAVKLGFSGAKSYHLGLITSAFLAMLAFSVYTFQNPLQFCFLLAFIPLVLHLKRVMGIQKEIEFEPELKKVAISTFLLSLLLAAVKAFL